MRFTDFKNYGRRGFACNFAFLLEALEKLHPNDEELTEKLRQLDWEEPLHIVKRFKLPRSTSVEAVTEFASPMTVLIRMQNRRLLTAALKEDMLPKEQTHYSDDRHMRWAYGREGLWRHELKEAFASADWRSAELMIPWCGDRRHNPLFAQDWDRGPLGALCYQSFGANQDDVARCVKLALKMAAQEITDSPSRRATPADEIRERSQKILDGMLDSAAGNANAPLCETLLKLGARHRRNSLGQAFSHGLYDVFWEGLAAARAQPAAFIDAAKPLSRDDREETLAPILGWLCERFSGAVQSALESRERGDGDQSYEFTCYQEHKETATLNIAKALEDGLDLPGCDPAELAKDRARALAEITPCLTALGSEELIAAIDRAYPEPTPEELGELALSGQAERFKLRCSLASSAMEAGQWGAEQAEALAEAMLGALSAAARPPRARGEQAEALAVATIDLLAWLEAKAPNLLPPGRGGQALLARSALGTSARDTHYLMRLETETLDLAINRGASKPYRPRKA